MSEGEQPRVKRSRFDTSGPAVPSVPAAAKPIDKDAAKAALERARKLLELRQLNEKLKNKVPKASGTPAVLPPPAVAPALPPGAKPKTFTPASLYLDDQGREVDAQGRLIQRNDTRVAAPTLKLNERVEAKKPAEPKKPEPPKRSFYDPEMGDRLLNKVQRRPRASFEFVQHGRFEKQAEVLRLKAQFGEEAVKARPGKAFEDKRSAAPVGDVNMIPLGQRPPKEEKKEPELDPIPDVEWWDARILRDPEKITILVEHPVPIDPPAEEPPPPPMPLMLTAKERKKLKTQRRNEREKDRQEMIRQGLMEPPKPKVKISNLMRVLGNEAVADPSAMEAQVRAQMEEREQAHKDRNLARKLTPAERKENKHVKLVGAAGEGEAPTVAVYAVDRLAKPTHRFKVRANAEELHMTGCSVTTEALSVVVVEGGPKSHKRYNKLMLGRIKWEEEQEEDEDDDRRQQDEDNVQRKIPGCRLAWTGKVKAMAFSKFMVHDAKSAAEARKFLEERGVAHYWDLAEATVQ
ncbi:PRP3-domain-containing protein [Coccomyxa subellipsoidea C-169]|uniref:PRP3-domain-containing protein n=1 Tax=Coccomyxa subellipsoidea (strain C-169) TaxID=574566 RepID=I0Z954_COCSC|nr:PRP3-domain-containing protein [Coccomyxa subellipsoidea C-169]EIE27173.1 PRP3-domain-containing protein [Coccomyxa subellipsoidea C-169]|eukprot:XP_005651717.1 PRP3-domain-containing protein [Coccomyxa subellipsoidea C-169]